MTGIYAAPDRDRANQLEDEFWPEPSFPDEAAVWLAEQRTDWQRGKCFNCGCWADQIIDQSGEYECPNCGDTWNIYEPMPEIP